MKSLAAEARAIRAEERKAKARGDTTTLTSLHLHRTGKLRTEAFYAHLAYAFVRLKPFGKTVPGCKRRIDADRLTKKIRRFVDEETFQLTIDEWLKNPIGLIQKPDSD